MGTASKASAVVAALGLLLVGSAQPTLLTPDQVLTVAVVSSASDPAATQVLADQVAQADAAFAVAVERIRGDRRAALAVPRADRRAALKAADTRAERRQARRAYRAAAAPMKVGYAAAQADAAAIRAAAKDAAVAAYLASTSTASPGPARAYLGAVTNARGTLELALGSSRSTYITDTYDERELLGFGVEQALTSTDRRQAWDGYVSGTGPERSARVAAVAGARATYKSALKQARAAYLDATGRRVPTLKSLLPR